MENKHWSQEELLELLYEVGREEQTGGLAHLSECAECLGRWRKLLERRQAVLTPISLPAQVITCQNQAIQLRVAWLRESNVSLAAVWRPRLAALAMATLLVIAVVLHSPTPTQERVSASIPAASAGDAKLFEEVVYEVSSTEPAAVLPLRGLFEMRTKGVQR